MDPRLRGDDCGWCAVPCFLLSAFCSLLSALRSLLSVLCSLVSLLFPPHVNNFTFSAGVGGECSLQTLLFVRIWRPQEMRFLGQTLLASVFVLGACAGGDKAANSDTAAAAV